MKSNSEDPIIIRREGSILILTKMGLVSMIQTNTDKNSSRIDGDLIKMIKCFWGHLSVKQLNWILEKIKFIIRHNKNYKEYKGIKDIQFL
jgi:hypothetical protein